MKIVHLCLASFYIDGYSYQENLLPKWHKRLGYNVEIISSQQTFDNNGRITEYPRGRRTYINEYGISVTRLDYHSDLTIMHKMRKYIGLAQALEEASPDILFIHGIQFADVNSVVKYLKTARHVKVFVDNHADYSNSANGLFSKYVLHRLIWRHYAKLIEPYTTRFWGVLPARVDFLVENYKLPVNKCDLLVMGADDDEVRRASTPEVRLKTRRELDVTDDELLVVTGGKITLTKKQTLLLMDAVKSLNSSGLAVRLFTFGPVVPELKDDFLKRVDGEVIKHVDWADASRSYDYFSAADFVCFPGRHSVYWEQAAAMGKPLAVKWWKGTTHIDSCGNAIFLYKDAEDEIEKVIKRFACDTSYRSRIEEKAKEASSGFLYSDIALKSIQYSPSNSVCNHGIVG